MHVGFVCLLVEPLLLIVAALDVGHIYIFHWICIKDTGLFTAISGSYGTVNLEHISYSFGWLTITRWLLYFFKCSLF